MRMRKICEAVAILIGTVGWWGFVYPDLCLTADTCEAYEEDAEESDPVWEIPGLEEPVWEIGGIRIKSRVIEYVYQERPKTK